MNAHLRPPLRPARRLAALALAGVLPVLTACGTSPVGTTKQYDPSDGVSASVGSIQARNLLVVGSAANQPGVLSGVLLNSGGTAVTVSLAAGAAGSGQPVTVEVPAGGSVLMGAATAQPSATPGPGTPGAAVVQFASLPVPAGAVVPLSLSSKEGGTTTVTVPVLPATLEYATITPTPGTSVSPVESPTPVSSTPTSAPTGTASAESTANPS